MPLPLLISIPHAGLRVPPEVEPYCALTPQQIQEDGDGGTAEIYSRLEGEVRAFVSTDVARAIVDLNRAEDDRRADGVVKTHTCWNVPVYRDFPPEEVIETLLERYHRPYHAHLSSHAAEVELGIDCHTMAAVGPPIGPDSGKERPPICLSNADGTCPDEWLEALSWHLEEACAARVALNEPFKGGHIIRSHAAEVPWVQLEFSRAPFRSNEEKGVRLLAALRDWCSCCR